MHDEFLYHKLFPNCGTLRPLAVRSHEAPKRFLCGSPSQDPGNESGFEGAPSVVVLRVQLPRRLERRYLAAVLLHGLVLMAAS